ncbi:sulfate transporter [Diaporthe eres]|uniref:STAS domain-containing protein n=1 Tax=Diaporthe vaccinii TaxID=105482 RepID=A0ABR4DTC1_9PEZI|nr:sulfate transporter [Diaporthe eres]
MKVVDAVKNDVRTDVTWNKVGRLTTKAARALPSASARYMIDKVPIVGWLPRYNVRWLINDTIAGLTLGLMLIPQGLSYASLATIPIQYGLMSSWFPSALYAFMGTTKDLSTGPTSLIGLLTSDIVESFGEDSIYSPQQIASAVALSMGIFGMILGFLKLGFLLEFISIPIITGFISAVAITILLNQMGSLLGSDVSSDGAASQIHDVFANLGGASGLTCAIGFSCIAFLTILDKSGKRWGDKNRVFWLLSILRAFLALVLYTGISYAVNHNLDADDYLFKVVKVKSNGLETPTIPSMDLVSQVLGKSITVFVGAAIEHTAIARAFGVRNDYIPDQSQELCYFGVCNFFNSFFHSMGVGGAMSRTSVNSSCRVKSPLSGFVTTAIILLSIYKLVGLLYWIPKATLAAIIICAVWPLIYPPSTFYRFWKTSLADFITSMLAFWITLFYSTEFGIFIPVAFNIVYLILRQTFASITASAVPPRSELASSLDAARGLPPSHVADQMMLDVHVFRFNESFFFPNSHRLTARILDSVQTHHGPIYNGSLGTERERNWSVVAEKRINRLRIAAGVTDPSALPPIGLVVLDFGRVNHIDITAVSHLKTLTAEIYKYGGKGVEFRFVDMSPYVRERFERAGWRIVDGSVPLSLPEADEAKQTRLFNSVAEAVMAPRMRDSCFEEQYLEKSDTVNTLKPTASCMEDA